MTALNGVLPCCGAAKKARVPSPMSPHDVFAPIYFRSGIAAPAKATVPIAPPPSPIRKLRRERPSSFVSLSMFYHLPFRLINPEAVGDASPEYFDRFRPDIFREKFDRRGTQVT